MVYLRFPLFSKRISVLGSFHEGVLSVLIRVRSNGLHSLHPRLFRFTQLFGSDGLRIADVWSKEQLIRNHVHIPNGPLVHKICCRLR